MSYVLPPTSQDCTRPIDRQHIISIENTFYVLPPTSQDGTRPSSEYSRVVEHEEIRQVA
jgi:hypothetical protein